MTRVQFPVAEDVLDVFGRVCDFGQNAGILTFSQNARTKCAHSDKISECWHSAFFTECAHSSLVLSSHEAVIAQLGERQTEDLEVLGSIPSPGIFYVVYLTDKFVPGRATSLKDMRGFGAVGSA